MNLFSPDFDLGSSLICFANGNPGTRWIVRSNMNGAPI